MFSVEEFKALGIKLDIKNGKIKKGEEPKQFTPKVITRLGSLKFHKAAVLELLSKCQSTDTVQLIGALGVFIAVGKNKLYARGCDPKIDTDFYENKTKLFGKDGTEDLGTVASLKEQLQDAKSFMMIKLSAEEIRIYTL